MDEMTRSDAQLIERAITNHWKLPEDITQTLPEKLTELALHGRDQRVAVRAASVLLKMREQNEPTDIGQSDHASVCIYLPLNGRESTD
ncbi:MAG: hypothetical protein U0929_13555 [Planctomycetaceae bacterium]